MKEWEINATLFVEAETEADVYVVLDSVLGESSPVGYELLEDSITDLTANTQSSESVTTTCDVCGEPARHCIEGTDYYCDKHTPYDTFETQYILVAGNPVDGLFFVGPFNDSEAAVEYTQIDDTEWWTAPLTKPQP